MTVEKGSGSEVDSGVKRRDMLRAGAGGVAAFMGASLLGAAEAPANIQSKVRPEGPGPDPDSPSINGVIKEISDSVVVLSASNPSDSLAAAGAAPQRGASCEVTLRSDAKFWRSGPATLADFEPGDEVVLFVDRVGSGFEAWGMEPMYHALTARVESHSGDTLATDQGTIVLNEYTVFRSTRTGDASSADEIGPGQQVGATCRFDQASGTYVAANVAVLS